MTLNLIPMERLQYIPEAHWAQHEFCFRIHDMMADVLRQASAHRISTVTITFKDEEEARRSKEADNLLQFLKDVGREDELRKIVVNHVAVPLYADMLHFIYEALTCLERRKTTVAFALLRKPLKYSLFLASSLWADDEDFFVRLNEPAEGFDDGRIQPEERLALLRTSIQRLGRIAAGLNAETIFGIVFDRSNPKGFAPYFDMAAHLVTSYKSIRTEPLNLNFIFKDPNDDDLYEHIYFPLAYVLLYLYFLQLRTYGRMALASESFVSWAEVVMLGTFEAVFDVSHEQPITDWANETFGKFLQCVACDGRMVVARENAPRLFMAEDIECPHCGINQQFPLWWLLAQAGQGKASNGGPADGTDGKPGEPTSDEQPT